MGFIAMKSPPFGRICLGHLFQALKIRKSKKHTEITSMFTDSTMVNHHQTSIWENISDFFQASKKRKSKCFFVQVY